ncbi:MAG: carboxylating nicotinate-nucleotide diphosphorylase [Chloroflexi bacterium]|nr:carboxylating nicotinate-nucleotide diphosphorylase [Chloroflexota bacterium]
MLPITREILDIVDRALEEDLAFHDPTTACLVPPDQQGRAVVLAKAPGVLAGASVAGAVFSRMDPALTAQAVKQDGERLRPGDHILHIEGPASGILRAERTALNLIQRMSGIATLTSLYVKAVEGYPAHIVDTRKTAPGLRYLDKYAVRMGGGRNHRLNLADGILVKDNHIAALQARGVSLRETVERAVKLAPHTLKVEVEVETVEQAREALEGGAHILLLDNMNVEDMAEAVALAKGRAMTEASGGITLETVRAVAQTGVDIISVGALTHSVAALDISLDFQP